MLPRSNIFTIYIRVDGNREVGLGHLNRCLAIASFLEEKSNIQVKFIIGPESFQESGWLINCDTYMLQSSNGNKDEALEVARIVKRGNGDLLLTDSYNLNKAFYETLRFTLPTMPVIAIDDCGKNAKFPVVGFINAGLGADASLYPSDLLKYCAIGPEYFPVRKELLQKSHNPLMKTKTVKRVLVSLGASDPENQTCRIAGLLKASQQIQAIDLVLGPAYGSFERLDKIVEDDQRIVLHHAPQNLASLMAEADLAITGGGITCNELVFLGVPAVVLILADNQKPVGRAVEHYGCGKSLGHFAQISDDELLSSIRNLVENSACLFRMISNCKGLIDGKGGNRIAEFINTFLHEYNDDQYHLNEVIEEYESAGYASEEYARMKWGSQNGMFTRFQLAIDLVDWQMVDSWIDVGCGTGALLQEVEKSVFIDHFVGVDLCKSSLGQAATKTYKTRNIMFFNQNFIDRTSYEPFDLVTCIGVLQKCGIPLRKAIARLAELVRPEGQVFVTTKNQDWNKFTEFGYTPYKGHHWFRLDEIREAFSFAGLSIIVMNGFEPRIGIKPIPLEEAHSIYVLARRIMNDD